MFSESQANLFEKKRLRTIVAGSRSITNFEAVAKAIESCGWEISTLLSGTAMGVDKLGERWACACGVPIERYPADWSLGKHAGLERNVRMAEQAEALIAIHDGSSRGTAHMIETAKRMSLRWSVTIITPQRRFADTASLARWHEWLRDNWAPPAEVLEVLMNDFEKETGLRCPERLTKP